MAKQSRKIEIELSLKVLAIDSNYEPVTKAAL